MSRTRRRAAAATIIWTRLHPNEGNTLRALSVVRGVPQVQLLGKAVRHWLKHESTRSDGPAVMPPVAIGRRGDRLWARVRPQDKRAMVARARVLEQSACLLVRRAFVWWLQQDAPE